MATFFQGPDSPRDDDLATCIHCGLCLNHCPTYRVTGLETESPRGRVQLMTQWKRGELPYSPELARHLDLCLGCRACEAVCPSAVPYGQLIELGRAELQRARRQRREGPLPRSAARLALRRLLGHPGRLRAMGATARALQAIGLAGALPMGSQLPQLGAPFEAPGDGLAPASGERKHRVAFLTGCVMPILNGNAHRASVRLLQLAGCEIWFPPHQRCCGALFAHNGDLEAARRLRATNLIAFGEREFDLLVVNSAGCSSHLKDFYPELRGQVKDLFELLAETGLPPGQRLVARRVTYQDPCHLAHAQRIRQAPRQMLRAVPGVEFAEMPRADICCGSAGIYNLLEPQMSKRILDQKLDDLLSVDPEVVVTANPGCQLQLAAGLRGRQSQISVLHLAELIASAYVDDKEP